MKKVLITGANGFVGQNLIKRFKNIYNIYGIDRTSIQGLDDEHSFVCDISDFAKINKAIDNVRPDCVIHLAAIVHKNNADTSEKNYFFINYECSKNLFDNCKEFNVKKVIYASTIEIYGESDETIITENTLPNPKSYYAQSKWKAEMYLASLYADNPDHYAILRFSPLYGKGFTLNIDKRVYLKLGKISYYFKDGGYSFDFCSINNVLDFINYLIGHEVKNDVYILSDNKPISVKEIIRIFRKYNPNIKTLHLPYRLCSMIISVYEHSIGALSRKDLYLSKRNFDKLFRSTIYSNEKAKNLIGNLKWDIEKTLYGDES